MLVYNETKGQFVQDVRTNIIADKILDYVRSKGVNAGHDREFSSWQNSMQFMRNIVDDKDIDDEVRIAIEYQVPLTSKRVDFIISGSDADNQDTVVVVELKQWQKAEVVADDMQYSVKTYVAGANRIVAHPSYQAYSYAQFIKNYSEQVEDEHINIVPCAYLHNFETVYKPQLENVIYKEWYRLAPFFIKEDTQRFSEFVKKFIARKSVHGDILYRIDNGRIRPTRALQDSLVSMVKGKKEFTLLDEQVVIYDMCRKTMLQCKKDGKKRVMIIQGGPGTGKSVLAVNLLMDFVNKRLNASYVTKNSAPRNAFLSLLSDSDAKKMVNIKTLFRSPFGLSSCSPDFYDCLIVDEAHRLVKKMYGDWNGENQVKECIAASLFTIFMLDEDQRITTKDIGSKDEIRTWAQYFKCRVIDTPETKLISQFRCNGSDAYIQFLDYALQTKEETIKIDMDELHYEFKVFDDPNQLREELRTKNAVNNKSRMVAGYCYDWNVKNKRGDYDIELEHGFKAQWNLEKDSIWAINPKSFEQVGCIHTSQGLEFDYAGVFIGRDLTYNPQTRRVETHKEMISKDDKSSGIRTAADSVARTLILNTYKTLLTRGQKGCYVYCEDENLRRYFREML